MICPGRKVVGGGSEGFVAAEGCLPVQATAMRNAQTNKPPTIWLHNRRIIVFQLLRPSVFFLTQASWLDKQPRLTHEDRAVMLPRTPS
jgi:hypothetical protein